MCLSTVCSRPRRPSRVHGARGACAGLASSSFSGAQRSLPLGVVLTKTSLCSRLLSARIAASLSLLSLLSSSRSSRTRYAPNRDDAVRPVPPDHDTSYRASSERFHSPSAAFRISLYTTGTLAIPELDTHPRAPLPSFARVRASRPMSLVLLAPLAPALYIPCLNTASAMDDLLYL